MSNEAMVVESAAPPLVTAETAIPRGHQKPSLDLAAALGSALEEGRSLGGLVMEMARLAWGPSKIRPEEYFGLGLHSPRLTPEERATFLGKGAQDRLLRPHATSLGASLAHDKLRYELVLRGAGLPVPRTRAVVGEAAPPGTESIRTAEELSSYLSDPGTYPVFAKPVHGIRSGGTALLHRVDGEAATVQVGDHRVSLDELVGFLMEAGDSYLLQEVLRPSPATRDWAGARLVSTRVVATVDGEGETLLHAGLVKVPVGGNDVDNFWRRGNIAAGLDLDSGGIVRAVSMADGLPVEVSTHPDTGADLVGITIPEWTEVKAHVAAAAPLFAGLKVQAWDVALTETGPVLLEVNIGGDFSLPQLALGQGLATASFMRVLEGRE